MGVTVVHALGFGGKGKNPRNQKPWSIPRLNNNLVCPFCNIHCDRKQVIWSDEKPGYGQCPSCHKEVKFKLFRNKGPIPGKTYINMQKNKLVDDTKEHNKIATRPSELEKVIAKVKTISDPCRFLTYRDLAYFTGKDFNFISARRKEIGYRTHPGKKTETEELWRRAVLIAIEEGFTPPDLKYFL